MNVLHLPYNIANWTTIHVSALNELDGIKAKGLVFGEKHIFHDHNNVIYIPQNTLWQKYRSVFTFIRYVMWADVIHWYWDDKIFPSNWALKFIRYWKKPCLVEWLGGEIRIPEIEFKDNEAFKKEYLNFSNNTPEEQRQASLNLQATFSKYGIDALLCPEMEQYIDRSLFPSNYSLRQRIEVKKFEFIPPDVKVNDPIRIVHTPSILAIKGTSYVTDVMNRLTEKYPNIEYKLIHNVPHAEALKMIRECDIFLDQFILGSYGMAALEAMSMGKVVCCFIKDSIRHTFPDDLPIVNASVFDLESKIEDLIKNHQALNSIGINSRKYVEKHHDSKVLLVDLVDIYQRKIKGETYIKNQK